jgi:hypothetical protein
MEAGLRRVDVSIIVSNIFILFGGTDWPLNTALETVKYFMNQPVGFKFLI